MAEVTKEQYEAVRAEINWVTNMLKGGHSHRSIFSVSYEFYIDQLGSRTSEGTHPTVARDKGLEELIHNELRPIPEITEKAMFGGWAWLLNGKLLCGARDDGMLVRLGKGQDTWALEIQGVMPMLSRGRTMHGWVRCGPEVYGDEAFRKKLLSRAIEFVRSLPEK